MPIRKEKNNQYVDKRWSVPAKQIAHRGEKYYLKRNGRDNLLYCIVSLLGRDLWEKVTLAQRLEGREKGSPVYDWENSVQVRGTNDKGPEVGEKSETLIRSCEDEGGTCWVFVRLWLSKIEAFGAFWTKMWPILICHSPRLSQGSSNYGLWVTYCICALFVSSLQHRNWFIVFAFCYSPILQRSEGQKSGHCLKSLRTTE